MRRMRLGWVMIASTLPLLLGSATATATEPAGPTVGGQPLAGAVVGTAFTVAAPDLADVAKAKFLLDGTYLGTDQTAPFSWPVQTDPGAHELEVRVYDTSGAQTRVSATFTAGTTSTAPAPAPSPAPSPTTAPSPSPAAPTATPTTTPSPSPSPSTSTGATTLTVGGAPLLGAVVGTSITVTAPDLGGTVKVKFRLDGTYLGTAQSIPFTWPVLTTAGAHELEVRMYDEIGEQGRLSATFTVSTTPAQPSPTPAPVVTPTPAPEPTPVPAPGTVRVVAVRDSAGLVAALAAATPGTTITLADGVYSAKQQLTISTACTASAPCVLRGGRGAVLDGTGLSGHYGLHLQGADHWTVSGLTVRNASKGIVADETDHSVIDAVEVTQIGAEGIHLRGFSSDNVVRGSLVHHTGVDKPQFGEGIYIGSSKSNWGTVSGGVPDTSDRNQITGNRIWATGAESVDIKEGTTAGVLSGNTFDGAGMAGENSADSWVDVKGNGWLVSGNTGTHALLDGFQTHVLLTGWGEGNTFIGNHATVSSAGYGFRFQNASTTHNVLRCDNVVVGAALGTANQACG
ncbi:MAG: hypothetical protein HGA44_18545 [Cellulomonadaceae bacterium]|nr:hypothetical protein [Cellulomonadaceae bacterium]